MEDLKSAELRGIFEPLEDNQLYFVTTQRNLMSILGAGMLVPANSQFRFKEDTRSMFAGAIPLWKGGIPNIDGLRGINPERLVVFEFSPRDVARYCHGSVLEENESVVVVNAPIPVCSAIAIFLSSRSEIDDFTARLPVDVPVDVNLLQEVPSALCALPASAVMEGLTVPDISSAITFIDSFGGAMRGIEELSRRQRVDAEFLELLIQLTLQSSSTEKKQEFDKPLAKISDIDEKILRKLLPLLERLKPEEGFDQLGLMSDLQRELTTDSEQASGEYEKWLRYAQRVLEAEIEVPALRDEGDIIKRGVLLYFLRPQLDRLKSAMDPPISAGDAVLSVATFLAGYAYGLQRMGPEYKGGYKDFSRFSCSLIRALWNRERVSVEKTREQDASQGAHVLYEVGGEQVLSLAAQQNPVLARVCGQARTAGFNFQYDYSKDELWYDLTLPNGLSQRVYIELASPIADGYDVVKFISPCLDLTGSKLKSLTKKLAVDLLLQNDAVDMYCAFAYSKQRKAIVVESGQLVKTMDDDELVMLIKHIATVAADYGQRQN